MTCNLWYRCVRSTEELLPKPSAEFVRASLLEPHSEHCAECRRYLSRRDRLNGILRSGLLGQSTALPPFEPGPSQPMSYGRPVAWAGALVAVSAAVIVGFGARRAEPPRSAGTNTGRIVFDSGSTTSGAPAPAGPQRCRTAPKDRREMASRTGSTPLRRRRLTSAKVLARQGLPRSGGATPKHRSGADVAYLDGRDPALASWRLVGREHDLRTRRWIGRRLPAYRDDFVRPEPVLVADADRTGSAVATALQHRQREAAVVDERLFTRVTLHIKATPLDAVCEELSRQTGVPLTTSADVRDENATLFLEHRPAREVMREISRLFGYYWNRQGSEGHYRYELVADLRSRLAEQEMRAHDADAALTALDDTLASYRPYLAQSPEQLRARAEQASGPERQRLEFAAERWAYLHAYQRLTQADRVSLAAGSRVMFILGASDPRRSMPDAWYQSIRSGVDGQIQAGAGGRGAQPYLSLRMDRSEMGQIGLHVGFGGAVENGPDGPPAWGGVEDGSPLATGIAPSVAHPNNAAANRSLAKDPVFRRTVTVEAIPSCPWFAPKAPPHPGGNQIPFDGGNLTDRPDPPHVTSADVWEALHHATGLDVVADAYTHFYPAARFQMKNVTAFDALCRAGDEMGLRWKNDGGVLLGRSTSYFWDKLKEVPERFLVRWRQDSRANHGLPLTDLLEVAGLADEQLTSRISGLVIEHCWGIEEWGILGNGQFRFGVAPSEILPYARAFALLTPAQLQEARSASGLTFESLNTRQKAMLARAVLDQRQSPEILSGLRFRFDYVPAGAFLWEPRNPDLAEEFLGKRPLIVARTREEALAAAARVSPGVQADEIHRTSGGISIHVASANGENWTLCSLGEGR